MTKSLREEILEEVAAYQPLTGEGYTFLAASHAWGASMNRNVTGWDLCGKPGAWLWRYFNFKPFQSHVVITDAGFRWTVVSYDNPEHVIAEGLTTSLYEAYQSAMQGREVKRDA